MKGTLVTLAVLLLASAAEGAEERQPSWGLSLHGGPYRPEVGDASERGYYNLVYRSPNDESLFKNRPMLKTVDIDWYFVSSIGLLGPYVSIGGWSVDGPTRVCGTAEQPLACTPETVSGSISGTDKTSLTAYPMTVGVIYRMDLAKRLLSVPLVPYVRAGLTYVLWRNTVGGEVSRSPQRYSAGGTTGYQARVGLALNLDFLEPDAAARARSTTGIADSYLFGELTYLWIDGFGNERRLDFSGRVYSVGVGIDFL